MRYPGPKLILYSETPSPTGLTEDLLPSASLSQSGRYFHGDIRIKTVEPATEALLTAMDVFADINHPRQS